MGRRRATARRPSASQARDRFAKTVHTLGQASSGVAREARRARWLMQERAQRHSETQRQGAIKLPGGLLFATGGPSPPLPEPQAS